MRSKVYSTLFCFFLFASIAGISYSAQGQSGVQCHLEFIDFQPSSLKVKVLPSSFKGNLKTYKYEVRSGASDIIIPIESATLLELVVDDKPFFMWGRPDSQMEIRINAARQIQFSGSDAADQRSLQALDIKRLEQSWLFAYPEDFGLLGSDLVQQIESRSFEEHLETCSRFAQENRNLSKTIQDNDLTYQIKYSILARRAADQLAYFLVHSYRYDATLINQKIRQHAILDYIPMNDEQLINNPEYIRFLGIYLHVERLKQAQESRSDWLVLTDLIDQKFSGKIRNRLLGRLCIEANNTGAFEELKYSFKKLYKLAPGSSESQFLDVMLGSSFRFDEEGVAPIFNLPDEKGNFVSLANLKGKVVYLSVWATWCKPCLAGFEKSRYLREEMQKRGIVLVNISVDKDPNTWKGTMSRVAMPGINLLSSNNDFLELYNISSLPVYHIIDKNGNFTYLPEGNRNILEEFEKLANQ